MRQVRHSSLCIVHSAFCIALAFATANARADWLYDGAASPKTLTEIDPPDGGPAWVLTCTASGQNLTLTGVQQAGTNAVLNLRLPMTNADGDPFAVTTFGNSLFAGNAILKNVLLPDTLTSIGNQAFYNCTSLTNVAPLLPDAVSSIGYAAFQNAPVEGTLRLGFGGSLALRTGDWSNGSHFRSTKVCEIVLGPGVTALPNYFATGCTALTNVLFQTTALSSIETEAFNGCTALRTVTPLLPDTLRALGYAAFHNDPVEGTLRLGFTGPLTLRVGDWDNGYHFRNTKVGEILFGPGVKTLPIAFAQNSTALTNVVFATTNLLTIGNVAFAGCTALRTVTPLLPDTLTTLGFSAFQNAPVEGTLRLGFGGPLTLKTGDWSNGYHFHNTKIAEFVAGPGVTTLPNVFAYQCRSLAKVVFAEPGLATVGASAFDGCSSLLEVRFRSYPTFGSSAFNGVPANARFFLARDVDDWTTWLADPAHATPWGELSADAKAAYWAVWSHKRPVARAAANLAPFPKNAWLLRYSTDISTMIILR